MSKRIKSMTLIFSIILALGAVSIVTPKSLAPEGQKNTTQPKVAENHSYINITGNAALDAFCSGNGTDGLSWNSAHKIENLEIDAMGITYGIYLADITRHLIIENCLVTNSSSGIMQAGIRLQNSSNIRINESNINNNPGFGIYLFDCSEIEVIKTNITDNTNDGVYLFASVNNTFQNTRIVDNSQYGIIMEMDSEDNRFLSCHIEGNSGGLDVDECNHLLINDCTFLNNTGDAIYIGDSDNSTIDGCQIFSNQGCGISIEWGAEMTIQNCNITSNLATGIYMEPSWDNTISDNFVSYNNGYGMELYTVNTTLVKGNTVVYNGIHGLDMWGGDSGNNNTIIGNTFSFNNMSGLHFDDSNMYNYIAQNVMNHNKEDGIKLEDNQVNNTFMWNKISNNTGNGLYIDRGSANCSFENNEITNNEGDGFYVDSCVNLNFAHNMIRNNGLGIDLMSSTNCTVYGNNITENEEVGLYIDGADILVAGNFIGLNEVGIEVDSGIFNQFWLNELKDNSNSQAIDAGDSTWDDQLGIGNLWSDYTERYPTATQSNLIWNLDYEINGTSGSTDDRALIDLDFAPAPVLAPSEDLPYAFNTAGNDVSWNVTDVISIYRIYSIFNNGVLITTGRWDSDDLISISVDDLDLGEYEFKIVVQDGTAWGTTESSIMVSVDYPPEAPVIVTESQTINVKKITLEWGIIDAAESYKVYVDGDEYSTVATSLEIEFARDGEYSITVTAINVFGESVASEAVVITVLSTPKNIAWLYWLIMAVIAAIFMLISKIPKKK